MTLFLIQIEGTDVISKRDVIAVLLKPLQNKKGQKKFEVPDKYMFLLGGNIMPGTEKL